MAITIKINTQQRDALDESWIAQTVNGLRRDNQAVCVRINVKTSDLDILLTAGACEAQGGGGGGRTPTPRERTVLQHWAECGLAADHDFELGQLIRCLKRLERDI